jgi:hypothetical protein
VKPLLPTKIVSGCQTGVDRAALDVAMALGIPCGGWCPKGRKAEDGGIDARYVLRETPSDGYIERTSWNVRDSDGTLILNRGPLTGGTAQTFEDAKRLGKPHLIVDLDRPLPVNVVRGWMRTNGIAVLNVAGPRESKDPGIHRLASEFLRELLGRTEE